MAGLHTLDSVCACHPLAQDSLAMGLCDTCRLTRIDWTDEGHRTNVVDLDGPLVDIGVGLRVCWKLQKLGEEQRGAKARGMTRGMANLPMQSCRMDHQRVRTVPTKGPRRKRRPRLKSSLSEPIDSPTRGSSSRLTHAKRREIRLYVRTFHPTPLPEGERARREGEERVSM